MENNSKQLKEDIFEMREEGNSGKPVRDEEGNDRTTEVRGK